jgi:hypothetical protein
MVILKSVCARVCVCDMGHWRKIVQIDIYYYFQSFFNEHEYKYAVDVMRNSIHVCFEE